MISPLGMLIVYDRLTDLIQRPNAVYIVTDYLDMVIDCLDV